MENNSQPVLGPMPPGVSVTQRLFSEEVAIAASMGGETTDNKDWAYEFSNGRRFFAPDNIG